MAKKKKYAPKPWEHNPTYKNNGHIDNYYVRCYASMVNSPAWVSLSGNAVKLYVLLRDQYRERPEQIGGLIKCPYSYIRSKGIGSNETISRAFKELEAFGFIAYKTKGGHNIANEYKLSDKWQAVTDEEARQIKEKLKAKPK